MNCGVAVLVVATPGIRTRGFLTIGGERQSLWRAVDQDGNVLDRLVPPTLNQQAAKRFFRKLLKRLQYVPRVIIADKLKSYAAAKREILPSVEHRPQKGLNNRAENSHQPTRLREKKRRKFKSARTPTSDPVPILRSPERATKPDVGGYSISTMSEPLKVCIPESDQHGPNPLLFSSLSWFFCSTKSGEFQLR